MYNLIKIHVKGFFPPHIDKSCLCLDIQQDLFYKKDCIGPDYYRLIIR